MLPSSTTSVFWPHGSTGSGICYGWLKPAVCVAGVVEDLVHPDALATALSKSTVWDSVKLSCGGNPILLGTCIFNPKSRSPVPTALKLWALEGTVEFSFVLYRPHAPQSLRFYVIDPPENPSTPSHGPPLRDPYNELAHYDFTRPECRNVDQALNDVVINQLNASFLVQTVFNSSSQKSPKLLPTTASLILAFASYSGVFSSFFLVLSKIAATFTNLPLLPIPTLRIGSAFKASRRYFRLKDISATVQQLDVRIEQGIFFITQVKTLQRQNTRNIASYSVRYTNFFNTAWLIMNDMTLGLAFGTFLSENCTILADNSNHIVQSLLFHTPREVLYWLDAWPAGLKLNAQLSRFYVNTLVGIIDTWESILPPLSPSLFATLGFLSSIGGLTLLLSLLSDLLSLFLTVHLRIGYELARAVYWAAGVRLGGGLLWGVFRGKRRNVLRNRTDTWSYDLDQLLFGTVLFTLLAFLFPTALVYYVLFAGLRLATLLIQASIETLLAFMHHFPLFALMLRVKDPSRLPGGVCFSLRVPSTPMTKNEINSQKTSDQPAYLVLENQPIPLSAIFFQYIELSSRLARHYNPLRLLYQVLAGQHLSSIPPYSIRYALETEAEVGLEEKEKEKLE